MLHDPIRKFAASHPEFNLKSLIFGVASNPSGKLNRNGLAVTFDVRKSVFSATISVPNGEWCFDLASEELFFFQRTANVLDQARKAVECYCKIESPTASQHLDLAIHALRLAKLDVIYRAGILDATFETADTDDADELVRLLAVVPFAELIDSTVMMLNPTFGEASTIVGGADADLIVRTTLVDFKTTKEAITDPSYLDQLLGYFLLARYARRKDVTFPTIERVALYFSRCAHLWTHDVSLWTACAGFEELESWFFDHAKEVFQQDPIRVSSLPGKPAPVQSTKSTKK